LILIYDFLGEERDFNIYRENKLLRRAIVKENLKFIGEAANRILKLNKEFPIAEARKIVDLRNWVIHGYDKVDDVIIWGILTNHLPKLKKQVEKFIPKI